MRRLLHDVAQLAGQHQLAPAGHHAGFDEQHLATRRGVRQARRHADLILACGHLLLKAWRPEHFGDAAVGNRDGFGFAHDDRPRRLARDGRDLALQVADTGLARIFADDASQGAVRNTYLAGVEPVFV